DMSRGCPRPLPYSPWPPGATARPRSWASRSSPSFRSLPEARAEAEDLGAHLFFRCGNKILAVRPRAESHAKIIALADRARPAAKRLRPHAIKVRLLDELEAPSFAAPDAPSPSAWARGVVGIEDDELTHAERGVALGRTAVVLLPRAGD